MRKKIITYFTILSVCILVFSIVINKIIIDKKFPLKTNDLKGLEELTSKVFIFTTHNNNQKMDHMKLIHGLGLLPYTYLDNELTENPQELIFFKNSDCFLNCIGSIAPKP